MDKFNAVVGLALIGESLAMMSVAMECAKQKPEAVRFLFVAVMFTFLGAIILKQSIEEEE